MSTEILNRHRKALENYELKCQQQVKKEKDGSSDRKDGDERDSNEESEKSEMEAGMDSCEQPGKDSSGESEKSEEETNKDPDENSEVYSKQKA